MAIRTLLGMLLLVAVGAVRLLAPTAEVRDAGEPSPVFRVEAIADETPAKRLRVHHAAGVTIVPAHANRICALAFADEVLCLGLTPVAVPTDSDELPVDYLRDRLSTALAVRTMPGTGIPDLAAVQQSRPEIIVTAAIDRRIVDQLQRIAPTIVLRTATMMYAENGSIERIAGRLRDLASMLGREAKAEAFLVAFTDQLAALRERMQSTTAGKSIAFLRTRGRVWRLYGHRGRFGGEAVFTALGLAGPEQIRDDGITALDPERLMDFDCDFLIVVADPTPGATQSLLRLRRHPLWQRLRAVRTGHVHEVEIHRHWVLSGPLGKLRMATDLWRCVQP